MDEDRGKKHCHICEEHYREKGEENWETKILFEHSHYDEEGDFYVHKKRFAERWDTPCLYIYW